MKLTKTADLNAQNITTTEELNAFCQMVAKKDFIAIDTEFMREKTYYAHLCLIQASDGETHVAIDPLADDLDLSPLFDLLRDKKLCKVMHGCRQDLEIFYHLMGDVPQNIFDTQIAAMVLGFGENIGYKSLVEHYTDGVIDKAHRFTDWSLRPLKDTYIEYALADVIYLSELYPMMIKQINDATRMKWVEEEMVHLHDAKIHFTDPDKAWKKIKTRMDKPKRLAVLKTIAAWREKMAIEKDVPRGRILRDDCLLEIAASTPKNVDALKKVRGLREDLANSRHGKALLEAIQNGVDMPKEERPIAKKKQNYPSYIGPTVELLKVLLKMKADECNVAQRMVATNDDLYRLAFEKEPDVPANKGWRHEVFGKDVQDLRAGKTAFKMTDNGKIELVTL